MVRRPAIEHFLTHAVIANEPVDDRPVADLLREQIHVGFDRRDDGTVGLVPQTRAAVELLNGPDRTAARQVFTGIAHAADQARTGNAELNLRGVSLATSVNGFIVNTMMSVDENGDVPDVTGLRSGQAPPDPDAFRGVFQAVANETLRARAVNQGWMDLGPQASEALLNLVSHGDRAGRSTAAHAGSIVAHEIEHSVSPNAPGVDSGLQWLEEGTAEALAHWPGRGAEVQQAMGIEVGDSATLDPFTSQHDGRASKQYDEYRKSVLSLLGLAGISMYDEHGNARPADAAAARTLLQGDAVTQVPRDIARAIARNHNMPPSSVAPLAALIRETDGDRTAIADIADLVRA